MEYRSLINSHQKEFNDFPIMWAFSKKQFIEGMEKLGLKETDTDKVLSIGSGGFMRKTDAPAFDEMVLRHERELKDAFEDDQFAYDAFLYELGNHEFCITYEYGPTLNALGMSEDDVAKDYRLLTILKKAKDDYLKGIE